MAAQSIFNRYLTSGWEIGPDSTGWQTGPFESSGGVYGGSNITSYPSSSGSMTYNGVIIYRLPGCNKNSYTNNHPYVNNDPYTNENTNFDGLGNIYHRPYEYVSRLRYLS